MAALDTSLGTAAPDALEAASAVPAVRGTEAAKSAGNLDALFTRAVACLRAGDYAAAAALLRAVLDQDPDCAPAHAYAGLALFHLNQVEDAKWHLDRAVEVDPGEFLAWAKRGELWFRLACFPQAASDLRRALTLEAPSGASRKWAAKMLEEALQRSRNSISRNLTLPALSSFQVWSGYLQALARALAPGKRPPDVRSDGAGSAS